MVSQSVCVFRLAECIQVWNFAGLVSGGTVEPEAVLAAETTEMDQTETESLPQDEFSTYAPILSGDNKDATLVHVPTVMQDMVDWFRAPSPETILQTEEREELPSPDKQEQEPIHTVPELSTPEPRPDVSTSTGKWRPICLVPLLTFHILTTSHRLYMAHSPDFGCHRHSHHNSYMRVPERALRDRINILI